MEIEFIKQELIKTEPEEEEVIIIDNEEEEEIEELVNEDVEEPGTLFIENIVSLEAEQSMEDNYHVCSQCFETFWSPLLLQQHEELEHPTVYSCNHCQTSFNSLYDMKRHEQSHVEKQYKCSHCDKTFTRSYNLKIHEMQHKKAASVETEGWKDSPQNQTMSVSHWGKIKTVPREKLHKCSRCPMAFISYYRLKKHETEHKKVPLTNFEAKTAKTYKCSSCPVTFTRKYNLKIHEAKHQTLALLTNLTAKMVERKQKDRTLSKASPFTCTVCKKSFTKLSHMQRHERLHTGVKPFTCSQCNIAFSRSDALKKHEVTVHQSELRPFECSRCPAKFTLKHHVKRHEMSVHANQKERSQVAPSTSSQGYLCGTCKKVFKNLAALISHKKVHVRTGQFTHECRKCDSAFTSSDDLKVHDAEAHPPSDGQGRFECGYCEMKFTRSHHKNRHETRIHAGKKSSLNRLKMQDSGRKMGDSAKQANCQFSTKKYACTHCKKCFLFLSQLRRHEIIDHAGKKSVEAPRDEGKRVETNNKPSDICSQIPEYICTVCTRMIHIRKEISVGCDRCQEWTHSRCLGLSKVQLTELASSRKLGKKWDCPRCTRAVFNGADPIPKSDPESPKPVTVQENAKDLPYSCATCNKRFKTGPGLKSHARYHVREVGTLGENPHKCGQCIAAFSSSYYLQVHERMVHPRGENRPFGCSYCEMKFTRSHHAQRHESKIHASQKPSSSPSTSPSTLQNGQEEQKSAKKRSTAPKVEVLVPNGVFAGSRRSPLPCSYCNKSFPWLSKLQRHERIHTGEKPYKCSHCERDFCDEANRRKHVDKVHGAFEPPRTFFSRSPKPKSKSESSSRIKSKRLSKAKPKRARSSRAESKMVSSSGAKSETASLSGANSTTVSTSGANPETAPSPSGSKSRTVRRRAEYICTVCLFEINDKKETSIGCDSCSEWTHSSCLRLSCTKITALSNARKLGKTWNCPSCGGEDAGSEAESLAEPGMETVPEKNGRPSVCKTCSKRFKTVARLKIHERVHSGERPFSCTRCEKTFKYCTDWRRHEMAHSGERPHQCSQCEKSYVRHDHLIAHEAVHHGK